MGTRYSTQTISGYNSSPPADDGSTSESNKTKWSTVKTKIGDPVKTTVEAINSALVTAFDQSARSVSASDSTVAGDHNRTIQIASTVTASITISLGDAATMAAGYIVTVANQSNVACVVDRVTASNTINGVTATVSIAALESITFIVNSATNGYIVKNRDGAAKGAVTGSNLTMTTARLLGRTTASTGAIEEITAGTGLTLSGGSLTPVSASDTAAGISEFATQAEVDSGAASRVITSDLNRITIGAPATTTSGTTHDFTGIPSGVRRVTISFAGVSLSGTDDILVQLGDSGGFETTGYISSCGDMDNTGQSTASSTSGLLIRFATATRAVSGQMTLVLLNSSLNLWSCSTVGKSDSGVVFFGGGEKALSAVLTQVRITVTGANTFDAGTANIAYER